MFGLIKQKRAVHPLADEKAAKEFFKELPRHDPYKTLQELTFWLEATCDFEGLKPQRIFEIMGTLDTAARPHHRKITEEYIAGGVRLQKFQENRIFDTVVEFWRQLGTSYEFCLSLARPGLGAGRALMPHVPVIAARALHAHAAEIRWTMARYSPVDPALWARLGALYAQAEKRGDASRAIFLYPGAQTQTSVQNEFMKPLMLAMSAPDSLLPRELEVVGQIISRFGDGFVMHAQPEAGCTYVVDLEDARAPVRVMTAAQSKPSLRYFGPGSVGGLISALGDKISSTGLIPSSVGLSGQYEPDLLVPVLRHLALHWSSEPPSRKHVRHRSIERIHVVNGFDEVVDTIAGKSNDLDFHSKTEIWTVDNVSDGGFGALIPDRSGDWLRVGTLLGIKQTNDDAWGIGIVRRLSTGADERRYVGIQVVGKRGGHVSLFPADQGSGDAAAEENDAVLLPRFGDDNTGTGGVVLLMRPGYSSRPLRMRLRGYDHDYLLVPERIVEAGGDFDIARFRTIRRNG
jgi:hypothetical protein